MFSFKIKYLNNERTEAKIFKRFFQKGIDILAIIYYTIIKEVINLIEFKMSSANYNLMLLAMNIAWDGKICNVNISNYLQNIAEWCILTKRIEK